MAPLPTLSIQLYSVRRQLAEDLDGTLARLAAALDMDVADHDTSPATEPATDPAPVPEPTDAR